MGRALRRVVYLLYCDWLQVVASSTLFSDLTSDGSLPRGRSVNPMRKEFRLRGAPGVMEAPMASKVYVGGLSYSTTSESLGRYFAQCGTVQSATVITDRFSGQSRGFGFVEMSTEAEARAAIAKLDGQPFEGRNLRVNAANEQSPRGSGSHGPGPRPSGGSRSGGGFGGHRSTARW
jgi:RNA recognition motif-containing protein